MTCAFCATEFDGDASRLACRSCSMSGGCRKVKCPHCGRESPAEPASVRWIKHLFSRRVPDRARVDDAASSPICHGRPGAAGVVADFATRDNREVRKIMAMGVLPGTPIQVIQTFPACVFQIGYSQFAVDRRLAEAIQVLWNKPPEAVRD